ncbi:TPA: type-F conjugative transfer system protein TraW [Legionella anisa]
MNLVWALVLLVMLQAEVLAKSFGVVGEVFPVAEKSFLQLIEERLQALSKKGEFEALNKRWVNTVASHANRPLPLNLQRGMRSNTHYYLPQIILNQNITDSNGKALYLKGTRINALEHLSTYTPCWLFFNADDKAQFLWAKKQIQRCANPKIILTGGAIKSTENQLNAVIYFDQEGRITKKLNISAVPARVIREGNTLRIEEPAIKENGDVL